MDITIRIRDYDEQDRQAEVKRRLIGLMAKEKQCRREVEALEARVAQHESLARQALDAGEDALAHEIAERISDLDLDLAAARRGTEELARHVAALRRFHHTNTSSVLTDLQHVIDRLDAAAELEEGGEWLALERRMREAGIGPQVDAAEAVLSRVRRDRAG